MNTHRNLTHFLPCLLISAIGLPSCSFYYESQAKDMLERQVGASCSGKHDHRKNCGGDTCIFCLP
jgi:hypothetical protein